MGAKNGHEQPGFPYAVVPGQRWNGGYGGDLGPGEPFTGNDFGPSLSETENTSSSVEPRGLHAGRGPKGYKRSDERTREDVCEAIAHQAQRGHVDARDVEVAVASGVVTLSGTVVEQVERRLLEEIALDCSGVDEVRNELRWKGQETPGP